MVYTFFYLGRWLSFSSFLLPLCLLVADWLVIINPTAFYYQRAVSPVLLWEVPSRNTYFLLFSLCIHYTAYTL